MCISKCSIDFKAVCREKTETETWERSFLTALWRAVVRPANPLCPTLTGPSGRTCDFNRVLTTAAQWDLFLYPPYKCMPLVLALGSLRSHLFPKSVMQVSTAHTHSTVIRTDCTDDVTAKWMLDQWQLSANTECSRIRWHSYTKMQSFLNAVQIQKCPIESKVCYVSSSTSRTFLHPRQLTLPSNSRNACSFAKCHCTCFFSLLPPMCHTPRLTHSLLFRHPNNVWWQVRATKLLIMRFFPVFYYFLPLTPLLFTITLSLLPWKLSNLCISS